MTTTAVRTAPTPAEWPSDADFSLDEDLDLEPWADPEPDWDEVLDLLAEATGQVLPPLLEPADDEPDDCDISMMLGERPAESDRRWWADQQEGGCPVGVLSPWEQDLELFETEAEFRGRP